MRRKFSQRQETVVLFITHFWDRACAAQIARLRAELGGGYDICVTGFLADGIAPAVPEEIPAVFYREADFAGYREFSSLKARRPDLCGPRFFHDFPDYRHYWMIEYDVRYTGNWADLFAELDDPVVDLYGTIIQRKPENPAWYHWPGLTTGRDVIAPRGYVKVFTPLLRVSNRGFRAIIAAYARGWVGFYEALWGTALARAGLRIEDIGAFGTFTPRARRGRHYTCSALDPDLSPGSFAFRPAMLEHEVEPEPPLLWHPVKPAFYNMASPAPA
jgi:hypothetical protein